MSIVIWHNPRCSKSRATLSLLQSQGHQPEIIEYLKAPPNAKTLAATLKKLNLPARALLRKGETEYRALGLDDETLTEDALITAMTAHPILIERPIVIAGTKAVLGRPPEAVLEIL